MYIKSDLCFGALAEPAGHVTGDNRKCTKELAGDGPSRWRIARVRTLSGLRTAAVSPGGAGKSLCPRLLAIRPRGSSFIESIHNIRQDVYVKLQTTVNQEDGSCEHRRSGCKEKNFGRTVMKTGNTEPCLCPNWDLLAHPVRRGASFTRKSCSQTAYIHTGTAARTSQARRAEGSSLPRDTLITRSKR
jgi:hypothetical protein